MAATTPGHALTVAYNRKIAAAAVACASQGISFIPLACESLGGMHKRAVAEGKKLAAALARHSGRKRVSPADTYPLDGLATPHAGGIALPSRLVPQRCYLSSCLSSLLQRGNVAILLNRILQYPPGAVDGDQTLIS